MRVALVFGGRSVEHEVSLDSARTVRDGLERAGHEVVPIGIAPDGCWIDPVTSGRALDEGDAALVPLGRPVAETISVLAAAAPDVVFPIVHGTWGEDGALQGLLEMLDLPYVGAGVTPSAVAMDKLLTKRLLGAAGLPVVEFMAIDRKGFESDPRGASERADDLPLPLFVKPSVGGSSVGVVKVEGRDDLAEAVGHALRFDDTALVERGITGRELECSVLGYGDLEASAVGEILPAADFYDYADKYLDDRAGLVAPAELDERISERIRDLAVAAFEAVGGWGMARVDFLLEDGRPYLNELNTIPGFTSISMYPRLWKVSGVPLPELVDRLVEIAVERHRDRHRLDAGIHEFLAELAARHTQDD